MSPLVESIKLKDGVICNLEYHQKRLNRSLNELFPKAAAIDLAKELSGIQMPHLGIYKVRIVYGPIVEKIEMEPYTFRSVKSLKVVYCNDIDYHLKYTDRHVLNDLYRQREDCDDVIIVKDGNITDSFASNLLFFDGARWFTSNTPLLQGTKRELLLNQGLIQEKEIKINELHNYQKVGLINAMIDFEEMPVIALT